MSLLFWKQFESGQNIYRFENGYGASVVPEAYPDQYELAVLDSEDNITYKTPITDDVIRYMSEQEVQETLKQISEL